MRGASHRGPRALSRRGSSIAAVIGLGAAVLLTTTHATNGSSAPEGPSARMARPWLRPSGADASDGTWVRLSDFGDRFQWTLSSPAMSCTPGPARMDAATAWGLSPVVPGRRFRVRTRQSLATTLNGWPVRRRTRVWLIAKRVAPSRFRGSFRRHDAFFQRARLLFTCDRRARFVVRSDWMPAATREGPR